MYTKKRAVLDVVDLFVVPLPFYLIVFTYKPHQIQWNPRTRDTMGPTIVERSSLSRRSTSISMGLKEVSFVERSSLSRRLINTLKY